MEAFAERIEAVRKGAPEKVGRARAAVARGASIKAACAGAGVSAQTFRRYRRALGPVDRSDALRRRSIRCACGVVARVYGRGAAGRLRCPACGMPADLLDERTTDEIIEEAIRADHPGSANLLAAIFG